jgi:SAM-dependent methyltransferase
MVRQSQAIGSYAEANRQAWNYLARARSSSSTPWPAGEPGERRAWLDEYGWLPWRRLRTVLIVCGAGGQQAPAFASLGLKVTLVDVSEAQLAVDRRVAAKRGLDIELIQANVCDPDILPGRTFDLVYQPASTCYLPDPRLCYRNVAKVLPSGGLYFSEHWNPAQMQLGSGKFWDGQGYRITHPSGTGEALLMGGASAANGAETMFAHRLRDLIGGICNAGFVIERFGERGSSDLAAEPGSQEHLGAYLEPFYVVLARRTSRPTRQRQRGPAGQPVSARRAHLAQHSTEPPAVRGLRPLRGRLTGRRDLPEHWQRHGFVTLHHVLEPGRLVPALHQESLAQRATTQETKSSEYGIAEDGAYVSGGMSFTSAHPGSVLSWLSRHPGLLSLIRMVTGNDTLESSGDGAYMYYDGTSFIDLHTDVPECQATVLTSVVGQVPPLVAYPRLRGIGLRQLLDVANSTAGRPQGGICLEVPVGGLLIIDGRALPHRRPSVPAGAGPFGIATMCFARPTQTGG